MNTYLPDSDSKVIRSAYAKWPFLSRVMKTRALVVSRLRKDAALFEVPKPAKHRGRGRPRKSGPNRISLAYRGGHRQGWTTAQMTLYGTRQQVTWKTFLANYWPVAGVIRVVIVKCSPQLFGNNPSTWVEFFCTDPTLSAEVIIEAVADLSAIEQNIDDVKEVHGAVSSRCATCGVTWPAGACACGCIPSSNCDRGDGPGTH